MITDCFLLSNPAVKDKLAGSLKGALAPFGIISSCVKEINPRECLRGEASLIKHFPLSFKERGIKGVRLKHLKVDGQCYPGRQKAARVAI